MKKSLEKPLSELLTSISFFLGKKTLITGEVGTGKTKLTADLTKKLVELGLSRKITVIDIAPDTFEKDGVKVGGKLRQYLKEITNVRTLIPKKVYAPRLTAKNKKELIKMVEKNKELIKPVLNKFLLKPTEILIINDLSIYLQTGDFETVEKIVFEPKTFIANAYLGEYLNKDFSSGISRLERKLVNKLMEKVDIHLSLNP